MLLKEIHVHFIYSFFRKMILLYMVFRRRTRSDVKKGIITKRYKEQEVVKMKKLSYVL